MPIRRVMHENIIAVRHDEFDAPECIHLTGVLADDEGEAVLGIGAEIHRGRVNFSEFTINALIKPIAHGLHAPRVSAEARQQILPRIAIRHAPGWVELYRDQPDIEHGCLPIHPPHHHRHILHHAPSIGQAQAEMGDIHVNPPLRWGGQAAAHIKCDAKLPDFGFNGRIQSGPGDATDAAIRFQPFFSLKAPHRRL